MDEPNRTRTPSPRETALSPRAALVRVPLLALHRLCAALAALSGGQSAMVGAKLRTGMWLLSVSALGLGCGGVESKNHDSYSCYFVFIDDDGDGFSSDEDCDESDPEVYPGAPELCNEVDDDCDGDVDEDPTDGVLRYRDADGDGYGDPEEARDTCYPDRVGWTAEAGDCQDDDPAIHPDAEELCDGVDNNCDDEVDEGCPEE